jgi:hypothetical protein
MRRLWTAAAVATAFSLSGCGTVANLTNCDGQGREAYGGLTRDIKFVARVCDGTEPKAIPPLSPIQLGSAGGDGRGVVILLAAGIVVCVGGMVGEVALSSVADTCTLPLIPLLNWASGSEKAGSKEPALNPSPASGQQKAEDPQR